MCSNIKILLLHIQNNYSNRYRYNSIYIRIQFLKSHIYDVDVQSYTNLVIINYYFELKYNNNYLYF